MKKLVLASVCLMASNVLFAQLNFIGTWKGGLNGAKDLQVAFNILNENDELKATLDVPAQGATDMPCDDIRISHDSVYINMKKINMKYAGKLTDVNTITGIWTQNGLLIDLVLERSEGKLQLNRPQTPKPPYDYNSEDIVFYSRNKGMKFGGTITYPNDNKKHPAVILISGSGAQNRDEELFQHKPFAVVADHLTKHGYTVLRVDDRGVGSTGGDRTNATTEDYANDVREVLEFLKTHKAVDKKKIGLYGHSEGGAIAEMVAADNKDIDFIILMAGPGIKGVDLMTEQSKAVTKSMGLKDEAVDEYAVLYHDMVTSMIKLSNKEQVKNKLENLVADWAEKTDPKTVLVTTGITDSISRVLYVARFMDAAWNKWMVNFLSYDPKPYLEKLSCKVLALNGDKDIQVISRSNLEGMVKALDNNSKVKVKSIREIEGVNHLFQECKTCTAQEYGQLEQTMKPEVLDIITEWLDANVK